jgi:hypothetical protein
MTSRLSLAHPKATANHGPAWAVRRHLRWATGLWILFGSLVALRFFAAMLDSAHQLSLGQAEGHVAELANASWLSTVPGAIYFSLTVWASGLGVLVIPLLAAISIGREWQAGYVGFRVLNGSPRRAEPFRQLCTLLYLVFFLVVTTSLVVILYVRLLGPTIPVSPVPVRAPGSGLIASTLGVTAGCASAIVVGQLFRSVVAMIAVPVALAIAGSSIQAFDGVRGWTPADWISSNLQTEMGSVVSPYLMFGRSGQSNGLVGIIALVILCGLLVLASLNLAIRQDL